MHKTDGKQVLVGCPHPRSRERRRRGGGHGVGVGGGAEPERKARRGRMVGGKKMKQKINMLSWTVRGSQTTTEDIEL